MKSSIFNCLSVDMRGKSISTLFTFLLCAPAVSTATMFNDLNHWLADAPTGTSADWTAKSGIQNMIDDNGQGPTGFVGPGWGGQEYDAEAIYINKTGTALEIAVVTGMDPSATHTYGPGDIAIDLGYQESGPASFEIGIGTMGANAGQIFQIGPGGWEYGLWNQSGNYAPGNPDPAHPTSMVISNNTWLGNADDFYYGEARYNGNTMSQFGQYAGDNHYLIAVSIDLTRNELGFLADGIKQGDAFLAHWTMDCANDSIEVDPPSSVPEPASILLTLTGLLGLISFRRYRSS